MILRFRSPDGAFRVTVEPSDTLETVRTKLVEQIPKDVLPSSLTLSNVPSGQGKRSFDDLASITVKDAKFSHGDLLFLFYDKSGTTDQTRDPVAKISAAPVRLNGSALRPEERDTLFGKSKAPAPKNDAVDAAGNAWATTKQDPVDNFLEKQDGKITRPRDAAMCKHGPKGMCDYCMPLEPYDPKYMAEKNIKHLSFHSYLRQINTATNKPENPSSFVPPLSEPFYRIRDPCPSGHPPYPAGICSKCQPSAITLKPQPFRQVDHVEFSDSHLIDQFINFWRISGNQRIGYLYGKYEPYSEVPLGIKAVVEAIYEPPQTGQNDGLSLHLPWEQEKAVDEVAALCGLRKIGVIFTDLLDDGTGTGKVVCKRHIDSYYLSSLEICFAARMQAAYPNPSKWSESGIFGSKFVTCVVSGDKDGNIDIASYQVSLSAVEMVRADIIEPSTDPGSMIVKEEDGKTRYIPEVFYRKINKYGASVQENAKPAFPVEYLLVTLTHGFPQTPNPLFKAPRKFAVENREAVGQSQDLKGLAKQLGVTGKPEEDQGILAISDFHLLTYIHSLGILEKNDEALLCKAATSHELQDGMHLLQTPGWQTLLAILQESGERPPKRRRSSPPSSPAQFSYFASISPTLKPIDSPSAAGGDGGRMLSARSPAPMSEEEASRQRKKRRDDNEDAVMFALKDGESLLEYEKEALAKRLGKISMNKK